MSIFDDPTSMGESPVAGQEETVPGEEQQTDDTPPDEGQGEAAGQADETPPDEGQGDEAQDYVPANTYNELRGAFTRKAQEAAELKRRLESMGGQRQQPPGVTGQGEPREPQTMEEFRQQLSGKIAAMREEGYHEAIIEMTAKIDTTEFRNRQLERRLEDRINQDTYDRNRLHVQTALQAMETDYPDLASGEGREMLMNKIIEIARELGTPQIVARPSERIMRMAANEIWGDKRADMYQKAKAKGKAEALANIQAKQGLTAATAKKPDEGPKSIEDQLADSIVNAGRKGSMFG